jgi:Protein of unknown function (DUF1326)
MSASARTEWHISGESVVTCNCAWGCPCQFNAAPTSGRCQGLAVHEIREVTSDRRRSPAFGSLRSCRGRGESTRETARGCW